MKYIALRVFAVIVCILLLKTIQYAVNHVLITRLGRTSFIYQFSSRWGLIVFIFYWKWTYDIMPNYHVLIAVMMTYNLYIYCNFLPILKNLIKIFLFDCIRIPNCTQLFLNLRSKTCRRSKFTLLAYIQDLHKKSLKLVYGIGYFRSKMVDQLNKLSILK
jgi:hypothetical protein